MAWCLVAGASLVVHKLQYLKQWISPEPRYRCF